MPDTPVTCGNGKEAVSWVDPAGQCSRRDWEAGLASPEIAFSKVGVFRNIITAVYNVHGS